jgi:hypothetical protein
MLHRFLGVLGFGVALGVFLFCADWEVARERARVEQTARVPEAPEWLAQATPPSRREAPFDRTPASSMTQIAPK